MFPPATRNIFRNSVTHTETKGAGAWWKLRLEKYSYIKRIDIYNREDCCGDQLDRARVFVDGKKKITVDYEDGKNPYSYPDLNLAGEVIAMRPSADKWLHVAEVEVYGYAITGM